MNMTTQTSVNFAKYRFFFAIALKPKAISDDWNKVIDQLRHTIDSIENSHSHEYLVIVASHDVLPSDILSRENVIVENISWPVPREIGKRAADKTRKRRHIASILKATGVNDCYIMFLDADDWINNSLVAYVLEDDNRQGYLIDKGFSYSLKTGRLLREDRFDQKCGSCFIGYFENVDLPDEVEDKGAAFNRFARHKEHFHRAAELGKNLEYIPFRAAIYVLDHDESISSAKRESWRTGGAVVKAKDVFRHTLNLVKKVRSNAVDQVLASFLPRKLDTDDHPNSRL